MSSIVSRLETEHIDLFRAHNEGSLAHLLRPVILYGDTMFLFSWHGDDGQSTGSILMP